MIKLWFIKILILTIALSACQSAHKNKEAVPPKASVTSNGVTITKPEFSRIFKKYQQIEGLFDSLKHFESAGNIREIGRFKIRLADMFRKTGNYNQGIRLLKEALDLSDSAFSKDYKAGIFNGLAANYYEMFIHQPDHINFRDSSWHYAGKTLKIAGKTGNQQLIADAHTHKGAILIHRKRFDEAEQLLNEAYLISNAHYSKPPLAIMANLAYVYYKTGNYKKALSWANACYDDALRIENDVFCAICLETKAKIFKARGNDALAEKTRDRLNSIKSRKDVLVQSLMLKQLAMKYDQEKYRSTMLGLYREQYYLVRLSLILIVVSILLLVSTLTVLYLLRQNKKLRKADLELTKSQHLSDQLKIKNARLELQAKEAESRALKSELEYKDKELAAKLLSLSRLNEFLNFLRNKITDQKKAIKDYRKNKYFDEIDQEITKHVNNNIWEEFQLLYSSGNSSFATELTKAHPDLTVNEKRLSYLVLMGLNTKEIAGVMSKSYRSVEMARHRLRNKMGLDSDENLNTYFIQFHKDHDS